MKEIMYKEKLSTREDLLDRVDLVIFDWSGVISDDKLPVYEADMRLLELHGKPRMTFEEWLPSTSTTLVEFLADHGIFGDPGELFALYKRFFDEVNDSGILPQVYPGVQEVLQKLASLDKRLMVLSAHPEENIRQEAENYGFTGFFCSIFGNIEDKAEGLKEICKKMGTKPEKALYITDTAHDIQAAKDAGLNSVAICGGYHLREKLEQENPDVILESLLDLFNCSTIV